MIPPMATLRCCSLLLCAALALGCGGAASNGPAPSNGGADGEPDEDDMSLDWDMDEPMPEPGTVRHEGSAAEVLGITGPDTPWAEMSEGEQEFYMIGKVLPIMQEMFREHDAERYGSFGCESCHGAEMRELSFHMPVQSLFVVPERGTPQWDGMVNIFGDTVTFMEETVSPTMGTLLGIEDYGCNHCHPGAAAPTG